MGSTKVPGQSKKVELKVNGRIFNIILCFVKPPVPHRDHDWCAYLEGVSPSSKQWTEHWASNEHEAVLGMFLAIEDRWEILAQTNFSEKIALTVH
jgi:hypothetical protein